MLINQFLEAYPRTLPESHIMGDVGTIDMSGSRAWSAVMGTILHDVLSGTDIDARALRRMSGNYAEWAMDQIPKLTAAAEELPDPEDTGRIANELNFHHLNLGMWDMWDMLRLREKPTDPRQRNAMISAAQNDIAFQGVHLYASREKSSTRGNYSYFSKDNAVRRGVVEGIGNEFDAAIVLLELMKKDRELYVLPGPLQFEARSIPEERPTHYSNNADFVVVRKDQAVGIQVKSFVHEEAVEKYNPERIILVDARADFGNERRMRTQQESTRQKTVNWGAMLCAQRFVEMRGHGDKLSILRFEPQRAMQLKFLAKQLVGNMRPNLNSAVNIVSDRLMHSLETS
jgi:hypothetical protein